MTNGLRAYNNGTTSILLKTLDVIGADKYCWTIFYLQVVGTLGFGKSVPEFEEQVLNSKAGIRFDSVELIELVRNLHQIIDLVLVGNADSSPIARFATDEEMYAKCDMVIEMQDSWSWLFHSQEKQLISKLSELFETEPLISRTLEVE